MSGYKICSRCIMDTTSDPNLVLDSKGVCNYCHEYDAIVEEEKEKKFKGKEGLDELFAEIKCAGKGKEYDCLLGISGGVDSSYLAHMAKQYDLRVLAVHVDAGWNAPVAVENIEKICTKLGYDLHKVVIDWSTIKEMQRAFMFSGLANLDVVQDHAFVSACREMTKKYGIKYVLSGYNYATEGILSRAYQYSWHDWKSIKSVCRTHARCKIDFKKYPHQNFINMYLINPFFYGVKSVSPLNYIEYSKKMAIELLEKEYDWQYYGGKHYESIFTKFLQETYLPQRYGWEKRRDHISSLIVGGEMTREEGLKEIKEYPVPRGELEKERKYVLAKLEISEADWEIILKMPKKTEDDYANDKKLTRFCIGVRNVLLGKV